jgi:hypothetical protein
MGRLNWEVEQPQTPVPIRDAIVAFQERLKGMKWEDAQDVELVRRIWEEVVLGLARELVDKNASGLKNSHREYQRYVEEVKKKKLDL